MVGDPGKDGKDKMNGTDGKDGKDGLDGIPRADGSQRPDRYRKKLTTSLIL